MDTKRDELVTEFLDAAGSQVADPGVVQGDLGPNAPKLVEFENVVPGHGPIPTDADAEAQGMLSEEGEQGVPPVGKEPVGEPAPEPEPGTPPEGEPEPTGEGEGEPQGEVTPEELGEVYELLKDGKFSVTEGGKLIEVTGEALANAYRHRSEQDGRYEDLKAKEAELPGRAQEMAANLLRRLGVIDDQGNFIQQAPGAVPPVTPAEPAPAEVDYGLPQIDVDALEAGDNLDPTLYAHQNATNTALSKLLKALGGRMDVLQGNMTGMQESSANIVRRQRMAEVESELETELATRPMFSHEGRRGDASRRIMNLLSSDELGMRSVGEAVDEVERYYVGLGVSAEAPPAAAPAAPGPGTPGAAKTLQGKRPPVVGMAGRQTIRDTDTRRQKLPALGSAEARAKVIAELEKFLP